MQLSDPLSQITGIGPKLEAALSKLGLTTVRDLLEYYPRRYDDYSRIDQISHLKPGPVSVQARISQVTSRRARRGMVVTEAIVSDASGSVRAVWFNQPYRQASINPAISYFLSGQYKLSRSHFQLINPSIEPTSDFPLNSARIVPIYGETKGINSRQIRQAVQSVLELSVKLIDELPKSLIKELGLLTQAQATVQIHFPKNMSELDEAKKRLGFNELLPLVLASLINSAERRRQTSLSVPFQLNLAREFVEHLPFKLTDDQRRAIWQIYKDMQQSMPMNRLVEGDVGSGKTVVAAMAAVMALRAGYKVAFMAPTELLVRQHYVTIANLLKPLGMEYLLIRLSAKQSPAEKKRSLSLARSIPNAFMLGTHSLLSNDIPWDNLALLVIDEQHRFGVDQRRALQLKTGHTPHFLSITATPIPRTLALTLLSDLDLTRLHDRPQAHRSLTTKLIPPASRRLEEDLVRREVAAGHQVFVVCPYIRTDNSPKSAENVYEQFTKHYPKYEVGLIHGQMSGEDQDSVMTGFIKGDIQILIATTIVEVGVDVPNATVMLIYGPQHFGLAQLHQLRGRVGRGEHPGFCYLILDDNLDAPIRLKEFARLDDGFKLSELDLKLRGPGAIYGTLQHGKGMNRMLTLSDSHLNALTEKAAVFFLANDRNLLKCKALAKRVNAVRQMTYLN